MPWVTVVFCDVFFTSLWSEHHITSLYDRHGEYRAICLWRMDWQSFAIAKISKSKAYCKRFPGSGLKPPEGDFVLLPSLCLSRTLKQSLNFFLLANHPPKIWDAIVFFPPKKMKPCPGKTILCQPGPLPCWCHAHPLSYR